MVTSEYTTALLRFISDLTAESVPEDVWLRIEDLFLDWLASALAARNSDPNPIFQKTASQMGPKDGTSQILANGSTSSPYWAAWVNAASSHTLEQDDLHNSSVMHPATVIFPAVLAAAQDNHLSGTELLLASIVGYEAGIRIAEALGRAHYRTFHTTATAGTLAAALAVAKLLRLSASQTVAALGSAGTQTAGLWEFLRGGGDHAGHSKQLHCAHASANGLLSAYLARDGVGAASDVLEGEAGLLRALGGEDVDATRLVAGLGSGLGSSTTTTTRWAVLETSFKLHACCRHTHPAADALLDAMAQHAGGGSSIIIPSFQDPLTDVRRVVARVHQGAIDVLGPVDAPGAAAPATVHAAKFSMKTTLALIALRGSASLADFTEAFALRDPAVLALRERVAMVLDPDVDAAYPARWLGRVAVELADGRVLEGVCDEPKGDPGNTLTRPELEDKFRRLVVEYNGGAASGAEAREVISWCWALRKQRDCVVPLVVGKMQTNGANGS